MSISMLYERERNRIRCSSSSVAVGCVDRGASKSHFRTRAGCGCLRAARINQAIGRGTFTFDNTIHSFGMVPVYEKPAKKKRGKKPGAKNGHPGSRRKPPEKIDKQEKHRADICPDCGGSLKRCQEARTRYIEDIPEIEPEVTEHIIIARLVSRVSQKSGTNRCRCVARLNTRLACFGADRWLHYALGNTLSQIVEV